MRGDHISIKQELYDNVIKELNGAIFPIDNKNGLIVALMDGPQAIYRAGRSTLAIDDIANLLTEEDFPLLDSTMAAESIIERAGFRYLSARGMVCASLGRFNEAICYFDQALAFNPGDIESLLGKASALNHIGFFADSLKALKIIYALDQSNPDVWYLNGVILMQRGDFEEAILCLDEAVKLDPSHIEAMCENGNCRYHLGKYQEAMDRYCRIIGIDPAYPKAWYNKGVVLSEIGEYKEALQCYEEVLRINPGMASVWTNKGFCLAMLGLYNEAIESLDIALNINPGDIMALNDRASSLHETGREDEAMECIEKMMEIATGSGHHTVI